MDSQSPFSRASIYVYTTNIVPCIYLYDTDINIRGLGKIASTKKTIPHLISRPISSPPKLNSFLLILNPGRISGIRISFFCTRFSCTHVSHVTFILSCLSTFSLYKCRKLILSLSLSKNVPILVKNPNSPREILPPSLQRAKPRLFQPPSLFLKAACHRDRPRFFLVSDVQSRGRSRDSQEAERVRSEDRRSEFDSWLAPFRPRLILLGPASSEHGREDRQFGRQGDESVDGGGSFLSVLSFWLASFLFLHSSR